MGYIVIDFRSHRWNYVMFINNLILKHSFFLCIRFKIISKFMSSLLPKTYNIYGILWLFFASLCRRVLWHLYVSTIWFNHKHCCYGVYLLTLNFLNLVVIYTTLRRKRLRIHSTFTFDQVEYSNYNKSYRV